MVAICWRTRNVKPSAWLLLLGYFWVMCLSQTTIHADDAVKSADTKGTIDGDSVNEDASLMEYDRDSTLGATTAVFQAWKRTMIPPKTSTISQKKAVGTALHLQIMSNDNGEAPRWERYSSLLHHGDHRIPHRVGHALDEGHHAGGSDEENPTKTLEFYHRDEYRSRATRDFTHAFAGMRLHVFAMKDGQDNEKEPSSIQDDNNIFEDTFDERLENLPAARSSTTRQTNKFRWDKAYQLVEPMHMELGIPPKHYSDYAYTPVYNYQHPHTLNRIGGGETVPATSSTPIATTPNRPADPDAPKGPVPITEEDQSTCLAVMEGTEVEAQSVRCTELEEDHHSADDRGDSWWKWWFFSGSPWWRSNQHSEYTTGRTAFAGGSHGQVWKGRRVCDHRPQSHKRGEQEHFDGEDCDEDKPLILKRLKVEQGYRLLEAGLREVYFGQWIRDLQQDADKDLFTSYVDHFFRELPRSDGSTDLELWIVFEDAGPSLRSYIYAPIMSNGGFVMYQHSPLWTQLRMTSRKDRDVNHGSDIENDHTIEIHTLNQRGNSTKYSHEQGSVQRIGREIFRTALKQITRAAAVIHEGGMVHRDIKPSNVMCVSDEPLDDLYLLADLPNIHCRLGDFSSGWDAYTNKNLYTKGPSPAEQTDEYAPPEANIDPDWKPFDERRPQSYDSWSIGVLALELLLGTPNVFSVDQRTTVLLTSKMKKEGASDDEVQRALYLAALSQFCIYVPNLNDNDDHSSWPYRQGDPLHNTAMAKSSCTLQDFHKALRARDPLGIGFDSSTDLLLHLIWQLLAWDPMERITAAEALQHPFFLSPDGSRESLDLIFPGRHNALESQMLDARMDFNVHDSVEEFVCPKCGRKFGDWRSCNAHAVSRRHAKFCTYDRASLPSCINTHSMLPAHPTSGYCDLQGRRQTIEDFHSIHLYPEVQFYGIFDGHTGNVASKYAASTLFDRLVQHLPQLHQGGSMAQSTAEWKAMIERNVSLAYQDTHERFLDALKLAPTMDQSGTTATALLVTEDILILSSLGDSRAVLSSINASGELLALQLTTDHVASDPIERERVALKGGSVSSSSGGLERVNGTLAITRSIGDASLAPMLSREPHVTSMNREEILDFCGPMDSEVPCFIVLASDGLWDVMTNQEAVDMVAQVVRSYDDSKDRVSWDNGGAFQEAAEVLAVDAFVRGSTDNIGVCVVAIA